MPLRSVAQRGYLWAHAPKLAAKFQSDSALPNPTDSQLPAHVAPAEAPPTAPKPPAEPQDPAKKFARLMKAFAGTTS